MNLKYTVEADLVYLIKPVSPKGLKKMSAIFGNKNTNSFNSRDIYKYLGVKTEYARWIQRRIDSQGAEKNIDFTVVKSDDGNSTKFGGYDYIVTDDFAKHLGMLEKTKKGKEIRDYFIFMEKTAKYLLEKNLQENNEVIKKLKEHQYAKPRVGDYQLVDRIRQSYNIQASTHELNELLVDRGILTEECVSVINFIPNVESNYAIRQGNTTLVYERELLDLVDELEIGRGLGYEDHAPRLDI